MKPILKVFVLLILVQLAEALPRYSAQVAQSCHLCHVSPTGGGMRTSYGSQFFAGSELAATRMDLSELDMLSPRLSDRVEVGLDFRGMYYAELKPDEMDTALPASEQNSFFQMQGDLYLRFKLMKGVELMLDKGLRNGFEAWALFNQLPMRAQLKAGRFLPAYGWRWADHEMATRKRLGFSQLDSDSGLELEFHPDHWSFSLAVGNGGTAEPDGNAGKAITSRLAWNGMLGGTGLFLGLSARAIDGAPNPSTQLAGVFAGLNLGRLTWTGQADVMERGDVSALATAQEFAWKLRQGHELLLSYDSWDADIDLASGFDSRLRLAWDWIPLPVMGLQPGLARLSHDDGDAEDQWFLFDLQLHLFM